MSASPPLPIDGLLEQHTFRLSTGDLPTVANPTDQSVEPVISADSAPPPSTDVIKDLVVGKGATATASDTVLVMYVGALYSTGADFDRAPGRRRCPPPSPSTRSCRVRPGHRGHEGGRDGARS